MIPSVIFDKSLIAPCGMNCGTCIGYLRTKNRCVGCREMSASKLPSRVRCVIKNCAELEKTSSGFCYECHKFPCTRMKQLDRRYRTKYHTSFIENLTMIKEKGINSFLEFEAARRACPKCGAVLSVHKDKCLECLK